MLVITKKTITRGSIKFIIREDRLYIKTPLQVFLIEPTEYYHRKRLQRITLMIEMGHIRTYSDLFEQLVDEKSKNVAVRLIPIKKEWIR